MAAKSVSVPSCREAGGIPITLCLDEKLFEIEQDLADLEEECDLILGKKIQLIIDKVKELQNG